MNPNEELITKFYSAFKIKDFKTMQSCYADTAVFNDAVFKDLDDAHVKAMWEMLCVKGKDLQLEFKNISANEKTGSAEWTATYTFSLTGNKVINKIKATFEFEKGKITKHTDDFNFYTWAKQALGFTGLLLGWTPFLKKKIQKNALGNLKAFMSGK